MTPNQFKLLCFMFTRKYKDMTYGNVDKSYTGFFKDEIISFDTSIIKFYQYWLSYKNEYGGGEVHVFKYDFINNYFVIILRNELKLSPKKFIEYFKLDIEDII